MMKDKFLCLVVICQNCTKSEKSKGIAIIFPLINKNTERIFRLSLIDIFKCSMLLQLLGTILFRLHLGRTIDSHFVLCSSKQHLVIQIPKPESILKWKFRPHIRTTSMMADMNWQPNDARLSIRMFSRHPIQLLLERVFWVIGLTTNQTASKWIITVIVFSLSQQHGRINHHPILINFLQSDNKRQSEFGMTYQEAEPVN